MDLGHVVITFKTGDANRILAQEFLREIAPVSFLDSLLPDQREKTLREADALLTWNLPKELTDAELGMLTNVRLIQLLSAGADHLSYAKLPAHIAIASNVGAYAEPMAEHVLALTLALAKNLVREHQNLGRGAFNQNSPNRMLRGAICGILGFGGIGQATARLMRGLNVRIHAVNTSGRTDEPVEFIGTLKDLHEVLAASDIAVISLPLTKTTRGLINARELGWMKDNAILINVARGDLIDEAALYARLTSHPDFRAGIDAWWTEPFSSGVFATHYPFFALPNVVGSPHNSAVVSGMSEESLRRALENVKRFLKGEAMKGVVKREDYI
ncbi:MAG: 2-hydroxyacid dehydrogenase [Nitrospiraceae bacterium]|nr:2-hydroxyacid dehydrogenase [Nitrospiraceae bacterium]